MAKVTVVQVVYNSRRFMEAVFSSIFRQSYSDLQVVAVISGNEDGGKEYLQERFPRTVIIDPGCNIGFAKGHNIVFERFRSEYYQLVNPDLILKPDYVEKMVAAMEADGTVGSATGKLYRITGEQFQISPQEFESRSPRFKILDTTGVVICKSGRAYDRGQHEADGGQYDGDRWVDAVSGAGCMYRRSALLDTKLPKFGTPGLKAAAGPGTSDARLSEFEYFDEDFHSYWEDVDLSWRMKNRGWKQVFVPEAVGYHGRVAGSHKKGYADVPGYIRHHRSIHPAIRRLNYRNHIFLYIKNARRFSPRFFVRELCMLAYLLLFEWSTLKAVPDIAALWSIMWKKRRLIRNASEPS